MTSSLAALADRLEVALPGRVARQVPFAELTTYRLGGPAAVLVRVEAIADVEQLAALLAVADRPAVRPVGELGEAAADGGRDVPVPVLVVGRGSNLLVADEGFAGVVVTCRGELAGLRFGDPASAGTATVTAGGGVTLPALARQAAAAGRGGLEFLVGIPGSVGGAVRMNAGGHGSDTAAVLVRAWVADLGGVGGVAERSAGELDFAYRHSALGGTEVVVAAEFAVTDRDPAAAAAEIDEIVRWRREHQPGGANAGSVFTNPPGDSAGRLIDLAGLKGFAVGAARVSERHANFFQAEAGATAADVVGLVLEVRRRIEDATGISLRPELRLAAFAGMPGAAPGAPRSWDGAGGPARCPA